MRFDVGQSVRARDRLWEVQEVKGEQKATLLHLRCLDQEDAQEPLWVAVPPERVEVVDPSSLEWPREGLGRLASWKATHAALELSMNHGPGTLMSLLSSRVRLEPYQLSPVVRALEMGSPRLMIADDVGLGKTVEAGLILMELMARGLADSVLIVTPAGLTYQWQGEMAKKFGLHFEVFDRERIREIARKLPKGANPWDYSPRIITSVDFVKRDGVGGSRRYLEERRWDLVIVDEAHYLTPTTSITGTKPTDRSRFGEVLASNARALVLLTATPHNGHAASLGALLRLLDPSISERVLEAASGSAVPRDIERQLKAAIKERVIRRLKYEVLREGPDGNLEPYPKPDTVILDLGSLAPGPASVYAKLLEYADGRWRQAEEALGREKGSRRGELIAVQFAMSILKRRFLSSPHAFIQSLRHRRERLSNTPITIEAHRGLLREFNEGVAQSEEDEEAIEKELLTAPLHTDDTGWGEELRFLDDLCHLAEAELQGGDAKLACLIQVLQGDHDRVPLRPEERVIVFTEYRDTLEYLAAALEGTESKPGPFRGKVVTLHGGITKEAREKAFARFGQPGARVLLATDAIREGFNLQDYSSVVLHYETPWNPNRMEQRNGRVDRWGQKNRVRLAIFHFPDTYESHILTRVVERIGRIRNDLGSCSDFLGTLAVRDLERALMSGRPGTPQQMTLTGDAVVKQADDALGQWRRQSLLVATPFTDKEHRELTKRADEAQRLLPEFRDLEAFFKEALSMVNGALHPLDRDGRLWRITLPPDLAAANRGATTIERATFDRRVAVDEPEADFLTPVHPVARALIQLHRSRIYSGTGEGRTSYRVVSDASREGYLFTFTARIPNARLHPVKDVLVPVFVQANGAVSRKPEQDAALLKDGERPANVPRSILEEYREDFQTTLEHAREEAASRLRWHYKSLHDEMEARRNQVIGELDRIREEERKVFDAKYDTRQTRIDEAGEREKARDAKRLQKFLDELDGRRRLLNDIWSLAPLPEVRLVPVGCLILVPEEAVR